MPTLEEAARCPRCSEPGKGDRKQSVANGSTLYYYVCENVQCRWWVGGDNGGAWVVQVRRDGTIPERSTSDKEFPALDEFQKAYARRQIEDLKNQDLRETQ